MPSIRQSILHLDLRAGGTTEERLRRLEEAVTSLVSAFDRFPDVRIVETRVVGGQNLRLRLDATVAPRDVGVVRAVEPATPQTVVGVAAVSWTWTADRSAAGGEVVITAPVGLTTGTVYDLLVQVVI